jgi:small GTP-binding protein
MSECINENAIPCKVIMVGDSGVGKTSIIGRYLNKFNDKEKSTIGASFSNKISIIDKYKISFDIWDTAGQERYRSVSSIFYKEAYLCIFVYDITEPNSFENIKNYWYKTVMENASPKIILGIAGNKNDLYEKEKVKEKEVQKFCKEIDALYFSTSALLKSSIDDMFTKLGKKFIASQTFQNLWNTIIGSDGKKLNLKDNKKKKSFC